MYWTKWASMIFSARVLAFPCSSKMRCWNSAQCCSRSWSHKKRTIGWNIDSTSIVIDLNHTKSRTERSIHSNHLDRQVREGFKVDFTSPKYSWPARTILQDEHAGHNFGWHSVDAWKTNVWHITKRRRDSAAVKCIFVSPWTISLAPELNTTPDYV